MWQASPWTFTKRRTAATGCSRLDRSVRLVPSDGEQVHIDDQGKVLSVDIARERIEGGTLEGALFL
ncbi:hypothetical protein [uncultured Roseibium sp.]|uniref:hypothetical protein n=1 Tax=uncultured Roseibium sp. TaxID=1936171 RepID=UPI0032172093